MKPLGLGLAIGANGPAMYVRRPSVAEDAIWEAVKAAIGQGMSARQFRIEAAQAWKEELTNEGKDAAKELMR